MQEISAKTNLPPDVLLEIIRIQTEIVKLGLDLGAIMQLVADEVQRLTGCSGAIVEIAKGDEMIYQAASGIAKPQLGLRLKRATSLSGLCVETGEIMICEDSESDPRVDREACRKVGLRSMVVAPLFHVETAVGALKITAPTAGFFTSEHVCVLKVMSELIAASMFYSAKYEVQELYHQATHDILTGLANRALFYDRLRQSLAVARRRSLSVGVLNLDMDGLKIINDRYGHRAGDAAIREVAIRARKSSRDSDTVARLGGDEFAVILPQVEDRKSVEAIAKRIASEIRRPFSFEDVQLSIDASIGMAIFPEDAQELEELIEKADRAMYRIKRERKGGKGLSASGT